MTIQEKIRIPLVRRGNMSEAELARRLEKTPQNFHRKMKARKFTEADLEHIANILDCTVTMAIPVFHMNVRPWTIERVRRVNGRENYRGVGIYKPAEVLEL